MIRKTEKNDALNISKIIINGWETAYKGLIGDSYLNSLSIDTASQNWENNIATQNENNNIYVYEENNEILGVIRFGKPDDENCNYDSEIHVLYVKPELKRNGIGTKLFNFAMNDLSSKGAKNMIIWCLEGNTPSINFYKKMGGNLISTRETVVNNIPLNECGFEYKF